MIGAAALVFRLTAPFSTIRRDLVLMRVATTPPIGGILNGGVYLMTDALRHAPQHFS